MIVPGILTGVGVLGFTVEQMDKLQVIENRVYRRLMGGTHREEKLPRVLNSADLYALAEVPMGSNNGG